MEEQLICRLSARKNDSPGMVNDMPRLVIRQKALFVKSEFIAVLMKLFWCLHWVSLLNVLISIKSTPCLISIWPIMKKDLLDFKIPTTPKSRMDDEM